MQNAVVDMDPISPIITSRDVKGAFTNNPHRLLRAVCKHMELPFHGFLQVYLATPMYAVKTDVGTIPWVHSTTEVPQGGAEGPFLFLLVSLLLAFYIGRTYPDVAPYPLRTTLLAFADDMAVVTATARPPLSTTADTTRARNVLHAVTNYLEGNQLLVHNVKSATMVYNAPPPPLRPSAHEPSKHSHLPGGPTSGHCERGYPTTKPDTAANADTSRSAHRGTVHPGPGVLPTNRAQRS